MDKMATVILESIGPNMKKNPQNKNPHAFFEFKHEKTTQTLKLNLTSVPGPLLRNQNAKPCPATKMPNKAENPTKTMAKIELFWG